MKSLLLGLVTGCLLPGGLALAQEAPAFKPPLQRQLESQMLPEVRIHDVDFKEALVYLQMQAQASSQPAVRVPFVVQLPADFKPRYELTLDLKAVPFWEALRHLTGQAGVECFVAGDSVRIRAAGTAEETKAMVRTVLPSPVVNNPPKMTGRLGTPARPFAMGDKRHYNTSGELQPERSGHIPHRSLSGWSMEVDPGNRLSVNCIDINKCKAHPGGTPCPCGCRVCGCQPSKVEKYPGPQR